MDIPDDLKPAGRALWKQTLEEWSGFEGIEAILAELCRVHDRLSEIRQRIDADGIMPGGKAHQLLPIEAKLSGQFRMLWRGLGLSDDDQPKNRPGRPARS